MVNARVASMVKGYGMTPTTKHTTEAVAVTVVLIGVLYSAVRRDEYMLQYMNALQKRQETILERIVVIEANQIALSASLEALQGKMSSRYEGKCTPSVLRAILTASVKFRRSPDFVLRFVMAESTCNPAAVSRAGAMGLLQVLGSTHAALRPGVQASLLLEPEHNLDVGLEYLQRLQDRSGGDLAMALKKYTWGEGRVRNGITDSTFERAVLGTK